MPGLFTPLLDLSKLPPLLVDRGSHASNAHDPERFGAKSMAVNPIGEIEAGHDVPTTKKPGAGRVRLQDR